MINQLTCTRLIFQADQVCMKRFIDAIKITYLLWPARRGRLSLASLKSRDSIPYLYRTARASQFEVGIFKSRTHRAIQLDASCLSFTCHFLLKGRAPRSFQFPVRSAVRTAAFIKRIQASPKYPIDRETHPSRDARRGQGR